MAPRALSVVALLTLLVPVAFAQQTPGGMVESYDALADSILGLRRLESGFVGALLEGHRRAAAELMDRGEYARAAAEMVLFANEGDEGIETVRRRLLAAGHRYHPAGGRYEPGFVIVTREARKEILEAAAALEEAASDRARQDAWRAFELTAEALLIAG